MAYCSSCGAQLREGARFCESCGQAVQAPAARVPVAASMTAAEPAAPPAAVPAAGPFVPPPPASFGEQPAAGPRKSRRGLVAGIGGLAAVGVLGAVGYVVYDQLSGPNGGADSPQAAVIELSNAADAEDAVTALSLLPPGEVGPIVNLYQDVEAKATSTGVAAADDPLAGFDLHLEGVQVQPEQLGADVAAVTITSGTVSWTLDPDQLQGPLRIDPDGDVRRVSEGSADLVEVTRNATEGAPLRIMTVQHEGKWYVSPMYTLLELWRASQGLPAPDFSQQLDLAGTGAASAAAAVEEATGAIATYDVDAFLDLLSPDEAAALYHYRDAIVTALHRDGLLAELQSEGQLTVDRVDAVEGEEVDGRVPVTVRSASGTLVNGSGDYYSWTLDRNCLSYSENGDSDGGCLDEVFTELGLGADLASEFGSLTLLTQEVDGRWYLSPLATLVADARNVVSDLDADDVAGLLDVPQFGGVDGQLAEGETAVEEMSGPYESALFEMQVPAGKVFSGCSDDGYGWSFYGPDGRPLPQYAVLAADGGQYRVLVHGGEDTDSVSFTPSLSDVEAVTLPVTIPAGGGDGCGGRLVSFEATEGEPLLFDTEDGSGVAVIPPSGDPVWAGAFVPEESGQHFAIVHPDLGMSITPLADELITVGSTVAGRVDASEVASFYISIGANEEADITVTGEGALEPYIELYTLDGEYVASQYADYFSSSAVIFPYYESVPQIYQLVVQDYYGEGGTFQVTVNGY